MRGYKPINKFGTLTTLLCLLLTPMTAISAEQALPSIGDGVSSITLAEEKRLGESWLRAYRRQVPLSSDPHIIEYTENLIQRLAKFNPDAGSDFTLLVVKNPVINAFAAPGGIIGVNTGLYNYAQTEDQFASVMAHELAHLSQRHYARGVEKQEGQRLLSMAAILGSLLVGAAGGSEAGIATLQATQAGIIDQQLRFSRSFEQEADRIGMKTLVNAGFDPHSMSDMFEQMQRAAQFSTEPPEFLLTHPVTARRIADAQNRSREYPKQHSPSSLDYDLVRSRVLFNQEDSPQQAIARFESELKGFSPSKEGSRYGLALALIRTGEYDRATEILTPLIEQHPNHHALISAQADIEMGQKQYQAALSRLKDALAEEPNSYAINIHYSRLLASQSQYTEAAQVLSTLSQKRPTDPFIWYHLAEFAGLAGDILALHKARTEYFILHGDFDSADNQLNNIIKKFPDNNTEVSRAKTRLKDIEELRKDSF